MQPLKSVKSDRLLAKLGVLKALGRGEDPTLVGPAYELRREPEVQVCLVFHYDDEKRLCVGYAKKVESEWLTVESEPYTMRALGYYERRLKRIGNYLGPTPRR
jgi:hypothetical protein